MEELKNASIAINLNEGTINMTGSEAFVERNMASVFAFVEKTRGTSSAINVPTNVVSAPIAGETKTSNETQETVISPTAGKDKYKKLGIYSVDAEDGTISIHRKIPGSNNAEKMKNVALIVLYEKGEAIEGAKLKTLCEKQGCWDRNNSAAIFEREIKLFIKKKVSAQKWTIALTIDGEQAAVDLMEGMVNDKK